MRKHIIACGLLLCGLSAQATDSSLTLNLGVGSSESDDGAGGTIREQRLPLTLGFGVGDWQFDASSSYLWQRSAEYQALGSLASFGVADRDRFKQSARQVCRTEMRGRTVQRICSGSPQAVRQYERLQMVTATLASAADIVLLDGSDHAASSGSSNPPASGSNVFRLGKRTHRVNGWGDVSLGATRFFTLGDSEDAPLLDIRGSVKLGSGDEENGFSSGQTDWTLGATLSKYQGDWSYGFSASRSWLGKQAGYETRNVWAGDLFVGYQINENNGINLDYSISQSSVPGSGNSRALSLSSSHKLSKFWRLNLTASKGFGEGDPKHDFSASLGYKFW